MSTEDFQELVLARLNRIDQRQLQILEALKVTPKKSPDERLIDAAHAVKVLGCRTVTEVGNAIGISRTVAYRCPIIKRVLEKEAAESAKMIRPGFVNFDGSVEGYYEAEEHDEAN